MDKENFDPEFNFQKAMQAHHAGQFDEAERLLREILVHMPKQDSIMGALAGVLLSNGKLNESIELLKKARSINPENVDVQLNLGIAYQSIGQLEDSLQLISNAAAMAPDRADIQYNLANILLQTNQYPAAIEKLNLVIELNPKMLQTYHSLGAVYGFLQKSDEAINVYKRALEIVPNDMNTRIALGNQFGLTGQLDQAEACYLKTVENHPQEYLAHAILGKFYLDTGKDQRGKDALLKAYRLNPNDLNTNILLGKVSKAFNLVEDAEKYFRQALVLDPNNEEVKLSLRRVLSTKIPYWHFEMLADVLRNDAYQTAIEKKIGKDSVVLDIGTGSGLLAMMAARAGAKEVIACEMHQGLAQMAKRIIAVNQFENQIQVYGKASHQLVVGKELPSKVDLIVSEILDVGGLGEGVLPSIRHAVQHLGKKEVQLIPAKLQLYGQLIEIPSRSMVTPIRKISGFDLSPFEEYRIPDEYIKINLKAEKYKALSPVIPLVEIDFYNLPPVYPIDQARKIAFDLEVLQDGMAQAMVFWFDLFLDEEIMVSSKVDGALEHWGQALFCFTNPKEVKKGMQCAIQLLQSERSIKFEI